MHKTQLPGATARCAGFTLIEIAITVTLLVVSFAGISAVQIANSRAQAQSAEETEVTHGFRSLVEQIRGTAFPNIVATHQGQSYPVPALSGTATVEILVNETDSSAEAVNMGLPRDLDGDGLATTTDVSGSYQLLPVKITIAWSNSSGSQSRDFFLFLTED